VNHHEGMALNGGSIETLIDAKKLEDELRGKE